MAWNQGQVIGGGGGGAPSGPAGGSLTGTYPNPTIAALAVGTDELAAQAVTAAKIANLTVTDAQVAAANKDGVAGTASMRTLGTGAQQAAPGNVITSLLSAEGDLITRASGIPARLPLGSNGHMLKVAAGAPIYGFMIDPRYETFMFCDFTEISLQNASGYSFTNFATSPFDDTARPGLARFNNSTAAVGAIGLTGTNQNTALVFPNEAYVETAFSAPALSDGTDTYSVQFGFGDSVTAATTPNNCVILRYAHSVNSGNWQLVTRANGGVETASNSSTAFATGFRTLGVHVNQAGTLATFFVDRVSIGTVATTIPSGSSQRFGFFIKVDRTAGTTNRLFYVDYLMFWQRLSR